VEAQGAGGQDSVCWEPVESHCGVSLGFWEFGLGGSLSGSESLAQRLGDWVTGPYALLWEWMGGCVWVGSLGWVPAWSLGVWQPGMARLET
jgi:hypothetical protein